MNLRQQLEARATRGTTIGADALLSRLDSGLPATARRFRLAQPSLGFVATAAITLVLIGGGVWALRPTETPPAIIDVVTTSTTSTTTTTTTTSTTQPEATTTSTTEFVDAAVANRRFVWEFDPNTDDLDDLRTALETYDASPYVLIRLIDEGGSATQQVAFEYLAQPSAWNVQTLVALQRYGRPSGTYTEPIPWPNPVQEQIRNTLDSAAVATFGDDAELLLALQRRLLERATSSCARTGSCNFGMAWYAVPETVTSVSGERTPLTFEGTMWIVSDTGAGGELPFTATYADGWTIFTPEHTELVTISQPPVMYVVSPDLELWGNTDTRAELVMESRFVDSGGVLSRELAVPVDPGSGYWTTPAWPEDPAPGLYDIRFHATLPDGTAETTGILVYYTPEATRQFAFIRGVETSNGQPQLIVDYADFLGGEDAVQAAIEDGELPADQAEEGLPNDFYIRNQNPLLRTLPVDSGAPIYLFDVTAGEAFDFDDVTGDGLVTIIEDGLESSYYGGVIDSPVWLIVQDDVILQLEAQYLP